jgi:hypothetical protein
MAIFGVKSVSFGQIGGQNTLFLIKNAFLFDFGSLLPEAVLSCTKDKNHPFMSP